MNIGVAVIIVRDGCILVGPRINPNNGNGDFAPPGGKSEIGEQLVITACREVWEETGMELQLDSIQQLEFVGYHTDANGNEWETHFFMAEADGEPVLMEPNKCEFWGWYRPEEVPEPHFGSFGELLKCCLQLSDNHKGELGDLR